MVCLDETNRQLIAETRKAIPAKQGQNKRVDYEYRRNGGEIPALPEGRPRQVGFAAGLWPEKVEQ